MRELAACSKICVYTTALQGIPIKEVARFRAALLATEFAARINPEIDTTKCQGIMPCAVRVPFFGPCLAARSWDRKCVCNVRGQQGPNGAKFWCPFLGPPKQNFCGTPNRRPKKPRQIGPHASGKAYRPAHEISALWRRGVRSCSSFACLPQPRCGTCSSHSSHAAYEAMRIRRMQKQMSAVQRKQWAYIASSFEHVAPLRYDYKTRPSLV